MKTLCRMDGLNAAFRIPRGYVGVRYEQQERRSYRDCLVFYRDGNAVFKRYCYGEAAGLVFFAWIDGISAEGGISYREPFDIAVRPEELPRKLELLPDGRLRLDGKQNTWAVAAQLKSDPECGYGRLRAWLG